MAVIELYVGNAAGDPADLIEQPTPRPEGPRWCRYVAGVMAGVITALSFDARVDADAVQEAQSAEKARQAEAAARRMNAWIGGRLFGTEKAPEAATMLGGVVEFVEDGEVVWRVKNPLAVTAVDSEVLHGDTPDMWVLAQEVEGIGEPTFRPVDVRAIRLRDKNIQARLWGSPTPVTLNPCQIDIDYATSTTGICAADITTGQEFTPHVFPGLTEYPRRDDHLVQ